MQISINQKAMHRFTQGHPWVFRSDLKDIQAESAGIVTVISPNAKAIGTALYSPKSQIALRILSQHPEKIGKAEIQARIRQAAKLRQQLYPNETCYRVAFGESDALPSLIIDRYDDIIVFQSLSAGMECFKAAIIETLVTIFKPRSIVERNDVRVREKEGLPMLRQICWGEDIGSSTCVILGKKFLIRPLDGQKTGFFLDQRFNAQGIAPFLTGKILDTFSYSGQFAIHASPYCKEVLCVDDSEEALSQLAQNAKLNDCANITAHRANIFDFLKAQNPQKTLYDAILLDPPAFVKNRNAIKAAMRGYKEINLRAMKLLKPGGILVTSSCSQNLSRDDFLLVLRQACKDAKRSFQIIQELTQPSDHPRLLTMPESDYLKGFALRDMPGSKGL